MNHQGASSSRSAPLFPESVREGGRVVTKSHTSGMVPGTWFAHKSLELVYYCAGGRCWTPCLQTGFDTERIECTEKQAVIECCHGRNAPMLSCRMALIVPSFSPVSAWNRLSPWAFSWPAICIWRRHDAVRWFLAVSKAASRKPAPIIGQNEHGVVLVFDIFGGHLQLEPSKQNMVHPVTCQLLLHPLSSGAVASERKVCFSNLWVHMTFMLWTAYDANFRKSGLFCKASLENLCFIGENWLPEVFEGSDQQRWHFPDLVPTLARLYAGRSSAAFLGKPCLTVCVCFTPREISRKVL